MGSSALRIWILSISSLLQISFITTEFEPGLAVVPKICLLSDDELYISADWAIACFPVEW